MPHLHIVYCDSDIVAIVTKGYEDIVQETVTDVLQSFHEKIAVTKLATNSSKCCKFLLKIQSSCSHINNFGYPNPSSKAEIHLEELHVVLLEEMQKINWQPLMTSLSLDMENKRGSWTFYSPAHGLVNGVL